MKNFGKILMIFVLIVNYSCNFSKSEKSLIRKGNKQYDKKSYEEAEIQYRKAIEKKPNTFAGAFNLSDAAYKQQKFKDTHQLINQLKENNKDKKQLGMLYHNQGNTYLSTQKIDQAIEAYKNSLRKNPTDKETKYNLEYARHLKKKMQNQQQNKNQNKDKNKSDKDKQNQDQNKNQQQKADAEEKKQEQQQSQSIPKENAERILEALLQDEKKVKEKMEKEKLKKQKVNVRNPKDW